MAGKKNRVSSFSRLELWRRQHQLKSQCHSLKGLWTRPQVGRFQHQRKVAPPAAPMGAPHLQAGFFLPCHKRPTHPSMLRAQLQPCPPPVLLLTLRVEMTSSLLSFVAMAYRTFRSGSITVSPFSQRMIMGRSPRAVQFSSLAWPLMAMVVLGWEVIIAGTAKRRGEEKQAVVGKRSLLKSLLLVMFPSESEHPGRRRQ